MTKLPPLAGGILLVTPCSCRCRCQGHSKYPVKWRYSYKFYSKIFFL